MNQNYRTQMKPLKNNSIEKGFGNLNFDSMNHIKYYNKLPFKVLVDNSISSNTKNNMKYSITALTCSSGLIKPY